MRVLEKAMAPHSSTLAWKIPWTEEPGRLQSMGRYESDKTERLHFHFLLLCIGEGNGNLLQCSCLENPRDGGAWWAAVSGVTQSRIRLKWLSSSSSSTHACLCVCVAFVILMQMFALFRNTFICGWIIQYCFTYLNALYKSILMCFPATCLPSLTFCVLKGIHVGGCHSDSFIFTTAVKYAAK